MPSSHIQVECQYFKKGYCHYGSNCRFLHHTASNTNQCTFNAEGDSAFVIHSDSEDASPVATEIEHKALDKQLEQTSGIPPVMRRYSASSQNLTPLDIVSAHCHEFADVVNIIRAEANEEPIPCQSPIINRLILLLQNPREKIERSLDAMDTNGTAEDSFYPSRLFSTDFVGQANGNFIKESSEDLSDYTMKDDPFATLAVPTYHPPTFEPKKTIEYLSSVSEPDWSLLDNSEIINLEFGPAFDINDGHISKLMEHSECCERLQRFYAGDCDTGSGSEIRDEAQFIKFIMQCPSLRVIHLESFWALTDETLIALATYCPNVEVIYMSGHDKREGGVTGVGLQRLAEEVTLAPNLQVLELLNQIMQEDKRNLFEEFTRSRPRLKLYEGDMLGEGVTSNFLAALQGGAKISTWMGGDMVNEAIDKGKWGDVHFTFDHDEISELGMDSSTSELGF